MRLFGIAMREQKAASDWIASIAYKSRLKIGEICE